MTKNKYADKELRLWIKEEDDILRFYWDTAPFPHSSHHGSKFVMLKQKLEEAGYKDRTVKAVSRRTFRLGLKSYEPKETVIDCACDDCGKQIHVKKRYVTIYKKHRCPDCQTLRNREWDRQHAEQKRLYYFEWRCANAK